MEGEEIHEMIKPIGSAGAVADRSAWASAPGRSTAVA